MLKGFSGLNLMEKFTSSFSLDPFEVSVIFIYLLNFKHKLESKTRFTFSKLLSWK